MQETTGQRRILRQTGMPLIAAAFLGGAVLGALLVVVFCAFMPEGGVMPSQVSHAPEVWVADAAPTTDPVSAGAGSGTSWEGVVPVDGQGLVQSGAGDTLPKASWPEWSRAGGWRATVATLGVLFACLVGATFLVWSGRRANVRLEARVQRFEQLLARHRDKEGWLSHLDADLEGEWKDSR